MRPNKRRKKRIFFRNLLLYLWQLPQHLAALIVWLVLDLSHKESSVHGKDVLGERVILVTVKGLGVSLGNYIFLDTPINMTLMHERGHSKQSVMFGPLYLLIIGIPSGVFNNLWDRVFHKRWSLEKRYRWYYGRYPEKQADRLGGVQRNLLSEQDVKRRRGRFG